MVTNSGNNNTNSNKIKNDLQMVTDKIKKSERSSNNDIDTLNRAGNVIRSTLNNTTDKLKQSEKVVKKEINSFSNTNLKLQNEIQALQERIKLYEKTTNNELDSWNKSNSKLLSSDVQGLMEKVKAYDKTLNANIEAWFRTNSKIGTDISELNEKFKQSEAVLIKETENLKKENHRHKNELNVLQEKHKNTEKQSKKDIDLLKRENVRLKKELQNTNAKLSKIELNLKNESKKWTQSNIKIKNELLSKSTKLKQKQNTQQQQQKQFQHQQQLTLNTVTTMCTNKSRTSTLKTLNSCNKSNDRFDDDSGLSTESTLGPTNCYLEDDLNEDTEQKQIIENIKFVEHEIEVKIDSIKAEIQLIEKVLKEELNNLSIEQKKHIIFKPSINEITRNQIGSFDIPIIYELNKLIKHKNNLSNGNSKGLSRCIPIDDNYLLATDYINNEIKLISCLNGDLTKTYKLDNNVLSVPVSICKNPLNNTILIGDIDKHDVFIFDSSFNYLNSLNRTLNCCIKSPNYMTIHKIDDSKCSLYVTDWDNNILYSFLIDNNNLLKLNKPLKIDSPMHIFCHKDRVFTISAVQYVKVKNERKLDRITYGSNCIFELNSSSLDIIKKIKVNNWLNPQGLSIDSNGYLLSTALLLDADNFISDYRYLFLIESSTGICLRQFELHIKNIYDFVWFNDKRVLISVFKNEISIHYFE